MYSPLKLTSSVLATLICASAISLMAFSASAQPIAPSQTAREIHKTESKSISPSEAKMLNPQPLPPKQNGFKQKSKAYDDGFGPMPHKQNGFKQNPGDKVSLNPQPLPPKQGALKLQQGEARTVQGPPIMPAANNAAPKSSLSR
jgi:hypothetical protein